MGLHERRGFRVLGAYGLGLGFRFGVGSEGLGFIVFLRDILTSCRKIPEVRGMGLAPQEAGYGAWLFRILGTQGEPQGGVWGGGVVGESMISPFLPKATSSLSGGHRVSKQKCVFQEYSKTLKTNLNLIEGNIPRFRDTKPKGTKHNCLRMRGCKANPAACNAGVIPMSFHAVKVLLGGLSGLSRCTYHPHKPYSKPIILVTNLLTKSP